MNTFFHLGEYIIPYDSRLTFSNPRPFVNGALPVAINAVSTYNTKPTSKLCHICHGMVQNRVGNWVFHINISLSEVL